jgi:hypothetical protein
MLIQKININKKPGKSRSLYIMHCKAYAFLADFHNVEFTLDYLGIIDSIHLKLCDHG